MLWYKGWLETRFGILFALVFVLFPVALRAVNPVNANPTAFAEQRSMAFLGFYWSMTAIMLAGSGVKTQSFPRAAKGLHGSTYFTLALPVSRLRLLAVRAGLGMLETAAVLAATPLAVWIMLPATRVHLSGLDLLEYWAVISVCVSSFYFLGVLISAFWDGLAQNWASMATILILQGLSTNGRVPPSLNIFWAIGAGSPLFTHTFPWATMGVSLGAAAVMFCAAAWVVQTREY